MMKTRNTLAHRLRMLMDTRPDLDTQMKVHARAGISQSSVGRTLNQSAAATVDMVDDLADAFGVDPAELVIQDDTTLMLYQRIKKLPAAEQGKLLGYLDVVLSGALHNPQDVDMAIYRPGTGSMTLVETKRRGPTKLTLNQLPIEDPDAIPPGTQGIADINAPWDIGKH